MQTLAINLQNAEMWVPRGLAAELGHGSEGQAGKPSRRSLPSPRGIRLQGRLLSTQAPFPVLSDVTHCQGRVAQLQPSLQPGIHPCIYRTSSEDTRLGGGCFIRMVILNTLIYWHVTYTHTKGEILSAQLSGSSQSEHTQFKKQDIPGSPETPS